VSLSTRPRLRMIAGGLGLAFQPYVVCPIQFSPLKLSKKKRVIRCRWAGARIEPGLAANVPEPSRVTSRSCLPFGALPSGSCGADGRELDPVGLASRRQPSGCSGPVSHTTNGSQSGWTRSRSADYNFKPTSRLGERRVEQLASLAAARESWFLPA